MTRSLIGSARSDQTRATRHSRGFSLLEVIVAIAILGLGLTTILSAQAGLFSTSTRGANMTRASNLARCKMSELEVKLMHDGFPLTDLKDTGHCCDREDDDGFTCAWMVETIKLPEMNSLDGGVDGGGLFGGVTGSALNLGGGLKGPAGLNPTETKGLGTFDLLGQAMPGMGPMGQASPDSSSGGGLQGMAAMALTMVYPVVKPMFESSIRRISVSAKWHEGKSERTFDIAQYLTNPQQGGMLPGMPGAPEGIPGMPTGTAATPASPASPAAVTGAK